MDRQLGMSMPGLNEYGLPAIITTSKTYNWQGKVSTSTDANGNTTEYFYTARGFLEKTVNTVDADPDPVEHISLYAYDRAGRKTAEVSPENYLEGEDIDDMNRTEYAYDSMGRVLTKKEVYKEDPEDLEFTEMVTKAYKYDLSGNMLTQTDGKGNTMIFEYNAGNMLKRR